MLSRFWKKQEPNATTLRPSVAIHNGRGTITMYYGVDRCHHACRVAKRILKRNPDAAVFMTDTKNRTRHAE